MHSGYEVRRDKLHDHVPLSMIDGVKPIVTIEIHEEGNIRTDPMPLLKVRFQAGFLNHSFAMTAK